MDLIYHFNLANRHKDFNPEIMHLLEQQPESEILNLTTKEARIVYNWNRQVGGCYQRSRAFSRLNIDKHSIVHGIIDPEHHVEDLVAEWFLSRFPMFTVMIESKRGTFVISHDIPLTIYTKTIDQLIPDFQKTLPKNEILEELEDFNDESFWEKYYDSQLIKERTNKKYFLKNIPKKFHNWQSLKTEKNKLQKDKQLNTFIEQ